MLLWCIVPTSVVHTTADSFRLQVFKLYLKVHTVHTETSLGASARGFFLQFSAYFIHWCFWSWIHCFLKPGPSMIKSLDATRAFLPHAAFATHTTEAHLSLYQHVLTTKPMTTMAHCDVVFVWSSTLSWVSLRCNSYGHAPHLGNAVRYMPAGLAYMLQCFYLFHVD